MSSTLNKIADKLTGKHKEPNYQDNNVGGYGDTHHPTTHTTPGTGIVGGTHVSNTTNDPHSSNVGPHNSGLMNKLDPRVDNTTTSHTGGYGNTQTAGVGGYDNTHTGAGDYGNTHTGVGGIAGGHTPASGPGYSTGNTHQSTNVGPHSSNLANKLDPRVDSDMDGRHNPASATGGYGHTSTVQSGHNTLPGTGGVHHSGPGGPQSYNAGPHSSNLANKLDPRVDSDVNSNNTGLGNTGGYGNAGVGSHAQHHTTHHTQHGHAGVHDQTTTHNIGGASQSTTAGPHSSNLMNKLDPRVDSDRDGSNNSMSHSGGYGYTQPGHGVTGTHTHGSEPMHYGGSTNTGAQGYTGMNTTMDHPKSTNTGPHSSNLLNKLDPRVDSDRDGRNDPTSKTGGYGQTQTGSGGVGRY